jgi:4'-phosphopantetheinyl transferase
MRPNFDWLSPQSHPELSPQGVHVWRASLEFESEQLDTFALTLSDSERARAQRFVLERDRNSFIAARGILRDLLARYVGCAPRDLEFIYGPQGKPALSDGSTSNPFRFNLSHSHGLAVLAVTRECEIGVDVEKIRPERAGEEIANRYFSAEEVAELRALPTDQQAEGFFLCWTRKEAYVKALGEGLRFPLDRFRVSLSPGKSALLYGDAGARWSMEAFDPSFNSKARYAAAVVADRKDLRAEYFQWK